MTHLKGRSQRTCGYDREDLLLHQLLIRWHACKEGKNIPCIGYMFLLARKKLENLWHDKEDLCGKHGRSSRRPMWEAWTQLQRSCTCFRCGDMRGMLLLRQAASSFFFFFFTARADATQTRANSRWFTLNRADSHQLGLYQAKPPKRPI